MAAEPMFGHVIVPPEGRKELQGTAAPPGVSNHRRWRPLPRAETPWNEPPPSTAQAQPGSVEGGNRGKFWGSTQGTTKGFSNIALSIDMGHSILQVKGFSTIFTQSFVGACHTLSPVLFSPPALLTYRTLSNSAAMMRSNEHLQSLSSVRYPHLVWQPSFCWIDDEPPAGTGYEVYQWLGHHLMAPLEA